MAIVLSFENYEKISNFVKKLESSICSGSLHMRRNQLNDQTHFFCRIIDYKILSYQYCTKNFGEIKNA